ncbi:ATP synthase F1 subunit gamma [Clostridium intestinale]|uniref:ATP synthase F1 subunit gamma n=1 Tax=Clostridium intestinale TaxID=36845 RepID=UPI002DD6921F|nr:ATP synthase F1 subunit gamma [Clostridium intestinale]WRY49878.1 ATP synthase F1 subunit gamma [Clostridium intestinale]
MPDSLNDIKSKMRSVENTKQITMAMELVSSSKLKKYRTKFEDNKVYNETVLKSVKDVLASISDISLDNRNDKGLKAYIVITSDTGLAGGYNANILNLVEDLEIDKEKMLVISIGQKGKVYFKKKKYNVNKYITDISENPEYKSAMYVGDLIMDLYKKGEVSEINVIYTKFENILSQKPIVEKLFPIENSEKKKEHIEYIPSRESIYEYFFKKYIYMNIFSQLSESAVSEQASRKLSMESATNNADEMIYDLELAYNRIRQASITREITEIVSGAEALK